jgi:hypothetical protein
MRGIDAVAVRFERCPRDVERLCGPAQVARDQRDLRLGNETARPGHSLSRAERARGPPQERLFAREIAELRHRDAPECERRRIIAERHPVQRAEEVTPGEGARRCRDQ